MNSEEHSIHKGTSPKFSVIIPAYNEQDTIVRVVKEVLALDLDMEIIVIDDGSDDFTVREVRQNFNKNLVTLLRNHVNKGKGYSMRKALDTAKGQFIIFQDADLEYPPSNIKTMMKYLTPETDMVVGVRVVNALTLAEVSLCSLVCNKLFMRLIKVPDVWSGHRIIKRESLLALELNTNRFEVETELTIRAIKRKWNLEFTPISYFPRSKEEGKKIGLTDFFKICHIYAREMLTPWPT